MEYEIEIKEIEPIKVVYMKYRGVVTNANEVFPNVFKAIKGKANGTPFFNYIKMNDETKEGSIELCVPTDVTPHKNGIEMKEMPRIKALCVTHFGSYDQLSSAYDALNKYAKQHQLTLTPPFRECYIKGPGMMLKGNPIKYITELQFPIVEV